MLPPHPARRLALLEKAGLVDHQHGLRVGQHFQGVVAHHTTSRSDDAYNSSIVSIEAAITHTLPATRDCSIAAHALQL